MKKYRLILLFILLFIGGVQAQLNINHYMRVGRTRISIGNFTGAIEYFNIVIKFKPYLPEAYFYRGVAKHQLEDYRGAIIDYNKAIEIKPFYPQAYMNRGMAYHNLEEYKRAINDYNRGLEFDPDNEALFNNRGIAKLALKDIKGAVDDYNRALKIDSKSVNALMNISNAHIVEGRIDEAIRDLNRVIVIRPHFAGAYLNRGLARFEIEDYASALRDFDQSIKLEPDNALAFNNRGIVKHKLEDYQGAVMDYDMAIKLNPNMASAYFNRAMAKEILGESGFEKDYKIAAMLNPQFDLEARMLDAEQLAQNQQKKSNQTAPSPKSNDRKDNDSKGDNDKKRQEGKEEAKRKRRVNLVVEDSRDLPDEKKEEDEDVRVQDKNIVIDLQPPFFVSAFEKNSVDYERSQYYSLSIDKLNQKNNYNPYLTITNKSVEAYDEIFENFVLYFNARLEIIENSHNYMNRGIFHYLVGQYNKAMDDLNKSIELNKAQVISYFARANVRYKMQEKIEMLAGMNQEVIVPVERKLYDEKEDEFIALPEYKKIINDYDILLSLNPKFFFGFYNRAYIKLRLKEYISAMEDLNKAILLEPEFAEAYFNRGLTKIYLGDIEGGAVDLSRAGELGILGAYNIIKRYCN